MRMIHLSVHVCVCVLPPSVELEYELITKTNMMVLMIGSYYQVYIEMSPYEMLTFPCTITYMQLKHHP